MSKGRDRTVSQRPDGKWANKRNDKAKATSLHNTQKQGGGELTTRQVAN